MCVCVCVCACVFSLTANLLFTLDSLVLRSGGGWVFLLVKRLYLQWRPLWSSTSNAPVPVLQQGAHLRPHTVIEHVPDGGGAGQGEGQEDEGGALHAIVK